MVRIISALFSVILICSVVSATAMADFSADSVTSINKNGKNMVMKGKIYSTSTDGYGGAKVRTETSVVERGEAMSSITIIDKSKNKMYTLIPDQKMYMESEIKSDPMHPKQTVDKPLSKTYVRDDKFDGHPVKVYKAKAEGKEIMIWEATDLNGFPVKTEMTSEGATFEYHNISMKTVPASMFAIPSGYTKLDMSMPMVPGGY